MALSAELAKMLDLITDPSEREARRKELTELSENGLRQADYSRKMNELSEQKKAYDSTHQKNLGWYDRASKQFEESQKELRAAQEKISALEQASGYTGSTAEEDELQKQLAVARKEAADAKEKIGSLSNTVKTFNEMVEQGKLITAEKFDEEVTKRGDALAGAMFGILDLQDRHRKEFGTDLDRRVLLEEAQTRQNGNLERAYEVVTAKIREEQLRKNIEAEMEKKYNEKLRNSNVPYAPDGEPVLGPLQSRLQGKKDQNIPDEVVADGSGRLSSLIAQELRAEGKF